MEEILVESRLHGPAARTDTVADSVNLESIGCRLALSDVYAKVRFPEEA